MMPNAHLINLTIEYMTLGKKITYTTTKAMQRKAFLAVQDSSIGDIVSGTDF